MTRRRHVTHPATSRTEKDGAARFAMAALEDTAVRLASSALDEAVGGEVCPPVHSNTNRHSHRPPVRPYIVAPHHSNNNRHSLPPLPGHTSSHFDHHETLIRVTTLALEIMSIIFGATLPIKMIVGIQK